MNLPEVLNRHELSLLTAITACQKIIIIKATKRYFILSQNTYYLQIGFPQNKSITNKLDEHLN